MFQNGEEAMGQVLEVLAHNEQRNPQAEWLREHEGVITQACSQWAEQTAQAAKANHLFDPDTVWKDQVKLVARRFARVNLPSADSDIFHAYQSAPLKAAAAFNLLGSCRSLRKDGRPYTLHPMFVDYVVAQFSQLSMELQEKARVGALIHDLLEEDLVRVFTARNKGREPTNPYGLDPAFFMPDFSQSLIANLSRARMLLNRGPLQRFSIGDTALELMEPIVEDEQFPDGVTKDTELFYTHSRALFWLNLRCRNKPEHRVVKLADKVHDVLDFGYITKNPKLSPEEVHNKLTTKLAKIYFSTTRLHVQDNGALHPEVPKPLWDLFLSLFKERLVEFQISTTQESPFVEEVSRYYNAYATYSSHFSTQCAHYALQVGLV